VNKGQPFPFGALLLLAYFCSECTHHSRWLPVLVEACKMSIFSSLNWHCLTKHSSLSPKNNKKISYFVFLVTYEGPKMLELVPNWPFQDGEI
jgi:hypothetical protein